MCLLRPCQILRKSINIWYPNHPKTFKNYKKLRQKIIDLSTELNKFQYELLSLNETWLRPDTPPRLLVTPGTSCRLESMWTLVKPDGKRRLILGSVYRPPRRPVADPRADFDDLEEQYRRLQTDYPGVRIVMCGDLNCDLLKPECDSSKARLCELSDFSLHQCVVSSTFFIRIFTRYFTCW